VPIIALRSVSCSQFCLIGVGLKRGVESMLQRGILSTGYTILAKDNDEAMVRKNYSFDYRVTENNDTQVRLRGYVFSFDCIFAWSVQRKSTYELFPRSESSINRFAKNPSAPAAAPVLLESAHTQHRGGAWLHPSRNCSHIANILLEWSESVKFRVCAGFNSESNICPTHTPH
jgi:hypothetical protein